MEEEDGLKKDERVEISKDMEEENIVMCIASFNIHGLITTSVHYENVGGHREKLLFSNYYNFCIPTASQNRMVPLIQNLTIYFKRGSSVKKEGSQIEASLCPEQKCIVASIFGVPHKVPHITKHF